MMRELVSRAEAAGYKVEDSPNRAFIRNREKYISAEEDRMHGGWNYDEYDFDWSKDQPLDVDRAMAYLAGDFDALEWV